MEINFKIALQIIASNQDWGIFNSRLQMQNLQHYLSFKRSLNKEVGKFTAAWVVQVVRYIAFTAEDLHEF